MNICQLFRTLVAACAITAASQVNATPTLQVNASGILTGAKNVDVGGTLYDVAFTDGTCDSLFSGCTISGFTFKTELAAKTAGQALLDQVFIDGSQGMFDTSPLTNGCTDSLVCTAIIPYFIEIGRAHV